MYNIKNVLKILASGYVTSVLFFITVLIISQLLTIDEYSLFAFSIAFGGMTLVFVNLGSDTVMLKLLTKYNDYLMQRKILFVNLSYRIAGIIIVILICLLSVIYLSYQFDDAIAVVLLVIWFSSQGLYPNSLYEVVSRIQLQQMIILCERVVCIVSISALWLVENPTLIIVAVILLMIRIASCITQYSLWLRIESYNQSSSSCSVNISPEQYSLYSGISISVLMAQFFNAIVSYFNQLMLEANELSTDLAIYSVCFQMFSVVAVFQSTYIRIINREINNNILSSVVEFRRIFLKAGVSALMSLALVTFVGLLLFQTIDYFGSPWSAISQELFITLAIWSIMLGWGQVITRYIILMGYGGSYLRLSGFGAILSIILGYLLVPIYGALGVAIILLFVHSILIGYHTVFIAKSIKESRRADV